MRYWGPLVQRLVPKALATGTITKEELADPAALIAAMHRRYAGAMYDKCVRMLRDPAEAEVTSANSAASRVAARVLTSRTRSTVPSGAMRWHTEQPDYCPASPSAPPTCAAETVTLSRPGAALFVRYEPAVAAQSAYGHAE